jgi:hypothetical protein
VTINRVNAAGWGVGDKLTSAQQNAIDLNTTYALDKRAGQSDTLDSIVSLGTSGRILPSVTIGPDGNTTINPGNGNTVVRVTSAVTASRTYTLGTTGVQTRDVITIYCEPSFSSAYEIVVKDQSSNTIFTIGNGDTADGQWCSFIYLGGWRVFQQSQGTRARTVTFTGPTSIVWTCPRGVTTVLMFGCGGGGGGASGFASGNNTTDRWPTGGGGGGGAWGKLVGATVVPGEQYTFSCGDGGDGGVGGVGIANPGYTGLASEVYRNSTSAQIARFEPGDGGRYGGETVMSTQRLWARGGGPIINQFGYGDSPIMFPLQASSGSASYDGAPPMFRVPGHGGMSPSGTIIPAGGRAFSGEGQSPLFPIPSIGLIDGQGGVGGITGNDSGSYRGAGGGGGGGGGPFGNGGNGGNGGSGNSSGAGTAGANGTNASADGGGGGGGGGGGACGSTARGASGSGGNGARGKIILMYWK